MATQELITWTDFSKIDIRIGTVLSAENFPKARNPAYILHIDFGPLGIRKSSAQITALYKCDDLIGKQVVAVVNFPSKQIADMMSECLVLGAIGPDKEVTLLQVERTVLNGTSVG